MAIKINKVQLFLNHSFVSFCPFLSNVVMDKISSILGTYYISDKELTRSGAENACVGLGGHLVNIVSNEENQFLKGELEKRFVKSYFMIYFINLFFLIIKPQRYMEAIQ